MYIISGLIIENQETNTWYNLLAKIYKMSGFVTATKLPITHHQTYNKHLKISMLN